MFSPTESFSDSTLVEEIFWLIYRDPPDFYTGYPGIWIPEMELNRITITVKKKEVHAISDLRGIL